MDILSFPHNLPSPHTGFLINIPCGAQARNLGVFPDFPLYRILTSPIYSASEISQFPLVLSMSTATFLVGAISSLAWITARDPWPVS